MRFGPVAVDDALSLAEDDAVTVDVIANDTDVDGDALALTAVGAPAHGSAAIVDARHVLYTPVANYHGPDAFTYTIADGQGGTATASVAVAVTPVNDPPVAVDDAATLDEDTAVTIDVVANANLLESAKRSGVKRFVYLSAHAGPGYDHTRYMRAHIEVEDRIRLSGLTYSFVRPTGVFSALGDLVTMARMGFGSVAGDGRAKANPIHPLDVAQIIADAVDDGPEAIEAGGPEVLTREEVMRVAFDVVGKKPRIMHVPRGVFRMSSAMMRLVHPRLSDMLEFVAFVTTTDSVAPIMGQRTLRPWFEDLARKTKP